MSTHEGDEPRTETTVLGTPETRQLTNDEPGSPAEPTGPTGPTEHIEHVEHVGDTAGAGTEGGIEPPAPFSPVTPAEERPGPRPSTMALGVVLAVLAGLAALRELTDVHIDGGVVLIGLMIGVGVLFLVGSRRPDRS
jgi:hypothetical protein